MGEKLSAEGCWDPRCVHPEHQRTGRVDFTLPSPTTQRPDTPS